MTEKFDVQLRIAVNRYGDNHIDIAVENGEFYGMYHSEKNSFSVTDSYKLDEIGGIEALEKYVDEFVGLCVCELQ